MIRVLRAGLMTTVQDLGRVGFRRYGVVMSGAVDSFSSSVANWLVGNKETAACLEMTLQGAILSFDEDSIVAVCGADTELKVANQLVPMWRPLYIQKDTVLSIDSVFNGCRVYLAVAGGIGTTEVLGSRSTYLGARFGGYHGRALFEDDDIPVGSSSTPKDTPWLHSSMVRGTRCKRCKWPSWGVSKRERRSILSGSLRALPGEQYNVLSEEGQQLLWTEEFRVSSQADRMGIRLDGPVISLRTSVEMVSEGVVPGTVQLPPSGRPVILLADGQTTGGYPRILHVASIDLPKVGQLRPGQPVFFTQVELESAQSLLRERQAELQQLEHTINQRRKGEN